MKPEFVNWLRYVDPTAGRLPPSVIGCQAYDGPWPEPGLRQALTDTLPSAV